MERGGRADSMHSSSVSVIAWLALPPWADLNLNPLHAAGLWLDVMTTPPPAPLCTTW